MTLAADRDTPRKDGVVFEFPMKDNVKIFAGALVVIESSGYAAPGSTAATHVAAFVAQDFADNTGPGHAAGAVKVKVRRGCFRFKNSASGDAITLADVSKVCYVVDDEQVAKTHNSNARSVAGIVRDVDASGVWVEF